MEYSSWITQRIANRLPGWTDARVRSYSLAQQVLNPIAVEIENTLVDLDERDKNHYITSANLDLPDLVYTVQLPASFTFGTDTSNTTSLMYLAPKIEAITGLTSVSVTVPQDNSVEAMFDALPTRLIESGDTFSVAAEILPAIHVEDLETAVIGVVPHAGRLHFSIKDGTSFVDNTRAMPYSFLAISGTSQQELKETEFVYVLYNGDFRTSKLWQSIDKIEQFGFVPGETELTIHPAGFNLARLADPIDLWVDDEVEKILYHRLGISKFGGLIDYSSQQFCTVEADTLNHLYQGGDTLQVVAECELLYGGLNLDLNDIAIQPFSNRLYAIDDNYLYVFDRHLDGASFKSMANKTPGCMMVISPNYTHFARGESIVLQPKWVQPIKRVLRNRWTVERPDGTKAFILIDGSLVAVTEYAWIINKTYTEISFGPFDRGPDEVSTQTISFLLDQKGTYYFTLETVFEDATIEKDVVPIQVHSKEALTRIALPTAPVDLRNSTGIWFDSEQKLWLKNVNTAYRVDLLGDYAMVDFVNKVVYLRESYDSVSVTPVKV